MGELWHESASVQGVGFGGQNAYVGKYRVSRRMQAQSYTASRFMAHVAPQVDAF